MSNHNTDCLCDGCFSAKTLGPINLTGGRKEREPTPCLDDPRVLCPIHKVIHLDPYPTYLEGGTDL